MKLQRILDVLDTMASNQRAAGEALWFNVHNFLQSRSISIVFIVKDDILITPPTPADLLDPTIMRVMPICRIERKGMGRIGRG